MADRPILAARRRCSPWRWPAATAVALALLGGVLALPEAWIHRFFSPLDLDRGTGTPPRPWLVLSPPPVIEAAPAHEPVRPRPEPEPPAPPAADWWTRGWQVRVAEDVAVATAPTAEDSSLVVLQALDLPVNLAMLARPDSVLAARLLLMQREDGLRFDELKPYLHAMSRAAAYRDIQSRAADMYGDFLKMDIITPD